MRVLLDNNVNQRFAQHIVGHEVIHARQMGWAALTNGRLLASAEEQGFTVVITADKSLGYQQSLIGRNISVIQLNSTLIKWGSIQPLAPIVQHLLDEGIKPRSFLVVSPDT